MGLWFRGGYRIKIKIKIRIKVGVTLTLAFIIGANVYRRVCRQQYLDILPHGLDGHRLEDVLILTRGDCEPAVTAHGDVGVCPDGVDEADEGLVGQDVHAQDDGLLRGVVRVQARHQHHVPDSALC